MPSCRRAVAIGLTLLVLSAGLPAPPVQAASQQVPAGTDLAERVEVTLARHLEGERIATWLTTLPAEGLEREAAEWILAWLPLSDLVELDLPLLREHVELAAASYREAPWREQLPHELWLRFVVPHRVSQEPAQAWRRVFHEELWDRVREAASMEAAALEVNRWCREQATFQSTSGRDQGPLTTLARGIGRCEEEMILSICALRAVGLPARSCATPYWTFTDNNHAWVETWADGRWHYLGGCEPDRCLSRAWFSGAARRAGFVRSVGYGEFDPSPEPLYRAKGGSTRINSTAVYTEPITVGARLGGDFAELADSTIWVNVLNFGSLRSIARFESGGEIVLGPGEYALTAGDGETLLLEVVGGRSGERIETVLDEADRYDLAAAPPFWLRYPEADAAPARDLDLTTPSDEAWHARRLARRESDRAKLRALSEAEAAILTAMSPGDSTSIANILAKPFERASTLFLLLDAYPPGEGREDLLAFLEAADDKDLLELDAAAIRGHLDAARSVRGRLGSLGLALPDSIYREALLPARIEREPGGPWRAALPLIPLGEDPESSLDALLAAFHKQLWGSEEAGFFGTPLNPAQSWALGGGSERDRRVCLVGLLRRNGIPARLRHDRVEAWLGEWRELDARHPGDRGAGGEAPDPASGGSGWLDIGVTRGGLPAPRAESYRDFNLCRHEAGRLESPWWDPQLGGQEWGAGDYVLCSVNRVPGGSACGRLRGFSLAAGDTSSVEIALDAAPGAWDPGQQFFSGPAPAALRALLLARGLPREGLVFLFSPGEPATRMIEALGRLAPRLAAEQLDMQALLIGDADPEPWRKSLAAAGWESAPSALPAAAATVALPDWDPAEPLVYLAREGRPLFLRAGFDTAVDAMLHLALDLDAAEGN